MGTALALAAPATANAETIVSQATGRLVTTSLLSSATLDSLVTLKGAKAVNTTGAGDVVANTPLDAAAIGGLIALRSGGITVPVFGGGGGIIQLGAMGQYARANNDGSSTAFSGSVIAAPSLIGASSGDVTAQGPIGSPSTPPGATISVGKPATDRVSVTLDLSVTAASATQSVGGVQAGQYRIGALFASVGGQLVATPVSTIRPALSVLGTAIGTAGGTAPANPFNADNTVQLTTEDLQAAGLGSDINALPADTDLTQYLPLAFSKKVGVQVDAYIASATAALATVPAGNRPTLVLAISAAQDIVNPIVAGLGSAFQGQLGTSLRDQVQLVVNHRETNGGSFTQTALRVGLGTNGSNAVVDLASASVGPNGGPTTAAPTPPPTSTTGAGGSGGAGAGTGTDAGNGSSAGLGNGSGASLAHTGLPAETMLAPWALLALALLVGGSALLGLTASRRHRRVTSAS